MTKLLFRIQLVVLVIGMGLLLIAQRFSIIALVWSLVVCAFINWVILAVMTGKKVGYSFFRQIIDITPSFFLSLVPMLLIRLLMDYLGFHTIPTLLISGVLILILYIGASFLLKTKGFKMTYAMCFSNSKKQNK